MANLHSWKWAEDECTLVLCNELYSKELKSKISKILGKFPKLPFKLFFQCSEVPAFTDMNKALDFVRGTKSVFVNYKPGHDFKMGNRIANASTTKSGASTKSHSGLVRINDIRLQQATGGDTTFLANIIVHELLHCLGIDHASALADEKGFVTKNRPIMVSGKSHPLGLSYDDKQGIKERYSLPKRKLRTVIIHVKGKQAVLKNLDKPAQSVGKNIVDGKVEIPYVKPGRYSIVVDRATLKKFKLGAKDYEIYLTDNT